MIAESSALNAGASEREGLCGPRYRAANSEELAARQFVARAGLCHDLL